MIFTETVVPKGARLYKGLMPGIRMVKRTTNFFVSKNPRVAGAYGRLATYETTKPLRLFVLTHRTVLKILQDPKVTSSTKIMLRFAIGTKTTRARQVKAYRVVLRGRERVPGSKNTRPGQRFSVSEFDEQVFAKLSREFLVPRKYDGFFSPTKPTIFHGGKFHSEIMLCDARKSLVHLLPKKLGAPVRSMLTRSELLRALPALFVEYSKKQQRLTRPYGGFVIYLGGGMAVKLYLEARAMRAPTKVLRTSDFDFTFSVPRQIRSKIGVRLRTDVMRKIMTTHLAGFTAWLGKFYGVRPQIVVKEFVPPVSVLPSTGKRVYHVVSYALRFPGIAKPVDFVDTTLAHVPGLTREHIHYAYTKQFGMPIERLKFLSKGVLAVLAGSFATKDPALKSRNPLVGNRAEKGLKNAARLATLIKVKGSRPSTTVRTFVQNIQTGRVRDAFRHARQVLKNIKSH
jgi:hypothetical protein